MGGPGPCTFDRSLSLSDRSTVSTCPRGRDSPELDARATERPPALCPQIPLQNDLYFLDGRKLDFGADVLGDSSPPQSGDTAVVVI